MLHGDCLTNKILVLASYGASVLLLIRMILLHGNLHTAHDPTFQEEYALTNTSLFLSFKHVSAAKHVARHELQSNPTMSLWNPSWIGTPTPMNQALGEDDKWKTIEQQFLNSILTNDNINTLPLLGFLRIPKTGSTSMLTWAATASRHGPHFDCFLGPMDGSHANALPKAFFQQHFLDCPHRTYESTVWDWAKQVLPKLATGNNSHSLQLFTIVRDPFERLVSYFQYVHRIYPVWSFISTPEQNATILANNMSGWMELLATEGSKAFHLPYQKNALMEADWNDSIHLIQGPSPIILTTIQECFEASVLLLTEAFPTFFAANETRAFLASSQTQQNTRSRFQTRNQQELAKLRAQAQIWFVQDFLFYEAAVAQFRVRLDASMVDRQIVEECFRVLDSRSKAYNNYDGLDPKESD